MNLRDHLVDVLAEFVDVLLFDGGDEDAGDLAAADPLVFQFFQREITLVFGL